jgi:restriction system protein
MQISESDLKIMLPSGKQTICDNRIGWARTHLKKAGLIQSITRSEIEITPEGENVLKEDPEVIDDKFLSRYQSYRVFTNQTIEDDNPSSVESDTEDTPQEVLEKSYDKIISRLADDILIEITKQTPSFFENMIISLLKKMGYGGSLANSGTVTKQSSDEGIDGIIREDKLGFDTIYIQAKKWDIEQVVSRPEIQKFVGALAGQGATKGLFVTTAKFSKDARNYADKQHTTKIVLVDGAQLAKLMIEHNFGVSVVENYEIKKLDSDFFVDEDQI